MVRANDQFQGGIDIAQDHSAHSKEVLETRGVRYACRVKGFDDLGDPIIQRGSVGDVLCGINWPAGSRPIGAWAAIFSTVGGSTVHASGGSSSSADGATQARVAQGAAGPAGVAGQAGQPGLFVKRKIGGVEYNYDPATNTLFLANVSNRYNYTSIFGLNTGGNGGVTFKWSAADREGYNTGLYEIGGRGFFVGNSIYVGNGTASVNKSSPGGAAGPHGQAGSAGNANSIVLASSMDRFRPKVITSETMPSTATGINLYPIKDSSGKADTSFVGGGAALPFGWPSIVPGSRGAVLAGTEHTGQYPVYLHADPRMVAVNAGPDPDAGSVVYDTDGQGNYDPNRFGRLQSAWRVMPPFVGSLEFGKGGTLAHQHARGERDGVAGYGAYVDLSSASAVSVAPVITPSSSGPAAITGVGYASGQGAWNGLGGSAAAYASAKDPGTVMNNAIMNAVFKQTQTLYNAQIAARNAGVKGPNDAPVSIKNLNEPVLTVGLQSARVGGPIEPGHGKKDKHRVGSSGDSAINVGHLATGAPWYADMTRDGPLPFEKQFYPNDVAEFPLKSFVHLQYAPGEPNGGIYAFGPHVGPRPAGTWKMWAEVPEMKEGPPPEPPVRSPRDPDPPPPTRPPAPTTPSNPPVSTSGPFDIFWWLGGGNRNPHRNPSAGVGMGGSWRGAGATSRDDQTAMRGAGMGSPMGVQVRNPDRSRAPRRGIGIGPVDLPKSGIPLEESVRVSTMQPALQRKSLGQRSDSLTSFPQTVSFTSVVSRPTDLRTTAPDIMSSGDIDGDRLRKIMRGLPVVLREEAWGAFNGTRFVGNMGYGASRYDAPTSSGGKLFLPPEFTMKDVEAGSSPFTPSTSYVAYYPGVYTGWGIPILTTGGLKTGWRASADTLGALNFDRLDSAGAVGAARFGGTNGGRFYFQETGGGTLAIAAIADGQFLKRSGATVTSAAAAALTSGRVTNGVKTTDDVIIDDASKGLVLKDSAGTPHYWRLSVSTLGVLSTADLGTTSP